MSRLTVTAVPSHFWNDVGATLRGLGNLFTSSGSPQSGLEALEREHARIRLSSRHWLVG